MRRGVVVALALAVAMTGCSGSTTKARTGASSLPHASVTAPWTPQESAPSLTVSGIHAVTCRASRFDLAGLLRPVLTTQPDGSYDLAGLPILSVTPDGAVLTGTSGDAVVPPLLAVVLPDGRRSTLYRMPRAALAHGQQGAVTAAQGDARWIAFATTAASSGQASIAQLGIVNRKTGAVSVFRTVPPPATIIVSPPVLFHGQVYWAEVNSASAGHIFAYDPVSGRTTTVDRGATLSPPTELGGGLYWRRDGRLVTRHPGQALPGFPLDAAKLPRTATDGTTVVWSSAERVPGTVDLLLTRPGLTAPVRVVSSSTDDTLVPLAVTGSFVFWSDGQLMVLDTRTGAVARIGDNSPGFSTIAAAGGTLAVNQIGSKGGAQLYLARTASLPELHC